MIRFEPTAIAYSPFNALSLAKAAGLAYQDEASICREIQQNWNSFNKFRFFEQNHTEAFMTGNDQLIVLAFRGTERNCLKDWMTDGSIRLLKSYGGLIHRGFSQALDSVWSDIVAQLAIFQDRHQPLLITGHSLGGALATLAVARLQTAGHPVQGLYTFGSPRVGDQEFVDGFNRQLGTRIFRLVNHNDVVTRVAPRSFGYQHIDRCLYFDSLGNLHNDLRFWRAFKESIKGSMNDFLDPKGLLGVGDHSMRIYEKNLLQNLNTTREINLAA